MIEVNLHPAGPKGRRKRASAPSLPAWLRPPVGGGGERDRWTIVGLVVPAIAVLAIAGMWLTQRSRTADLEESIAAAVADSTRLADLRTLSDSLVTRERTIRQRLELVRGLDGGRFVWPHILDELSAALPEYTWLTAIRVSTPLPDLGVQVDGLAANPLAITRFVRNLQESPFVARVTIIGTQQQLVQNVAAQAFKLVVHYADPPDDHVQRVPVVPGDA
ncbi:MAG: PilN domain-containing protein [Gemmatimonadota bacterium]|jgi:Tfp pilus assembly protein PilN